MEPGLYQCFFETEDWFWWNVSTRKIFFDIIDQKNIHGRILDVGCGTGGVLNDLRNRPNTTVGCDYSSEALDYCRSRGLSDLVKCSGTHLSFRDNSLSLLMSIDVIEHVDEEDECIAEMVRVCKSGGYILVHVPSFEILWTDKDDVNHHRRRYRKKQLENLLQRHGMHVETLFYINTFMFPLGLLRAFIQRVKWSVRPKPKFSFGTISHIYKVSPFVNRLMNAVMAFEYRLLGQRAPFGMSLVCLARKPLTKP